MAQRSTRSRAPLAATRAHLAQAMADIDAVLPGSIVIRRTRCGKRECACRADPPTLHGPYIQWTRTVHGKTVTRLLTQDQLARYQPWFDNARRLKDLIAKLEAASLAAAAQTEGWAPTNAAPPTTRSHPDRQGR